MEVSFKVADLLTVAGCAGVTLVGLQLVVKPILAALKKQNLVWLATWRGVIVNLAALIVSVGAAFLAQGVAGISYESGLQAFLTGLGGAASATLSYETLKNLARVARGG